MIAASAPTRVNALKKKKKDSWAPLQESEENAGPITSRISRKGKGGGTLTSAYRRGERSPDDLTTSLWKKKGGSHTAAVARRRSVRGSAAVFMSSLVGHVCLLRAEKGGGKKTTYMIKREGKRKGKKNGDSEPIKVFA